jgi:hypothetical protein
MSSSSPNRRLPRCSETVAIGARAEVLERAQTDVDDPERTCGHRGKLAVRNDREDRGNVGIIRSPIRASIPPDENGHVLPAETECNACARRINWPSGIEAKKYRQFHSQQSVRALPKTKFSRPVRNLLHAAPWICNLTKWSTDSRTASANKVANSLDARNGLRSLDCAVGA